ncbi:MAG: class I SAM-dependent methyltransferase [Candidatus Aquicultor sp.]
MKMNWVDALFMKSPVRPIMQREEARRMLRLRGDFGVLHHIPDNHKALGEVARVLKPGGRFIFMELLSFFTMNPVMRFLTQHPPDAQFTWEELAAKLKESGLPVPEDSCAVSPIRVIGVA